MIRQLNAISGNITLSWRSAGWGYGKMLLPDEKLSGNTLPTSFFAHITVVFENGSQKFLRLCCNKDYAADSRAKNSYYFRIFYDLHTFDIFGRYLCDVLDFHSIKCIQAYRYLHIRRYGNRGLGRNVFVRRPRQILSGQE